MKLSGIVRDSAAYGLGRVALSALDLALLPVYTRVLTSDDVGVVAIGAAALGALTIFLPLGLDSALARFYFDDREGEHEHRRVVGTLAFGVLGTSVVCALVLVVAGPVLVGDFLRGMSPAYFRMLIATALVGLPAILWLKLLQLRREPRRYVTFALMQSGFRGFLTIAFIVGLGRGAGGWIEAYLLTGLVFGAVAAVRIHGLAELAFDTKVLLAGARYATPVLIHQMAGWTSSFSSRFILNQLTTLGTVAVYQVAFGIGQVLSLVVTSFNFAYAPRFMKSAADSEEDTAKAVGSFSTTYVAGLVGLGLLISLFADVLVTLAAPAGYEDAGGIVPIIAGMFVLQGFYYLLVNPIFFQKSLVRYLPLVTVTGAVATVGGNYLLIPRLGIAGAAWAGLLANVLIVVLAYPLGQRALYVKYDLRSVGALVAAAVAAVFLSRQASEGGAGMAAGLAINAGLFLGYAGVAYWLGALDRSVIRAVWDGLVRPQADA